MEENVIAETYYSLAGQQSSKAFDGVNIVVCTYTDVTTKAVKEIRRHTRKKRLRKQQENVATSVDRIFLLTYLKIQG